MLELNFFSSCHSGCREHIWRGFFSKTLYLRLNLTVKSVRQHYAWQLSIRERTGVCTQVWRAIAHIRHDAKMHLRSFGKTLFISLNIGFCKALRPSACIRFPKIWTCGSIIVVIRRWRFDFDSNLVHFYHQHIMSQCNRWGEIKGGSW